MPPPSAGQRGPGGQARDVVRGVRLAPEVAGVTAVDLLVERMEGQLSVESREGEGTAVTVRLPMVYVNEDVTNVEVSPCDRWPAEPTIG